ncbi:hypothetical protein [Prevotella corporis]|uniref:hypothetical protein n=1 Tax=Prevotella corporis TaxID=28128 RepID=UPI00046EDD11|nr:hypothetical protein [Prevotella corporis]
MPHLIRHLVDNELGIVQTFDVLIVLCGGKEIAYRDYLCFLLIIENNFLAYTRKALVVSQYAGNEFSPIQATYCRSTEVLIVFVIPLNVDEVIKCLVCPFLWTFIWHLCLDVFWEDMELMYKAIYSDMGILLLNDIGHIIKTIIISFQFVFF